MGLRLLMQRQALASAVDSDPSRAPSATGRIQLSENAVERTRSACSLAQLSVAKQVLSGEAGILPALLIESDESVNSDFELGPLAWSVERAVEAII